MLRRNRSDDRSEPKNDEPDDFADLAELGAEDFGPATPPAPDSATSDDRWLEELRATMAGFEEQAPRPGTTPAVDSDFFMAPPPAFEPEPVLESEPEPELDPEPAFVADDDVAPTAIEWDLDLGDDDDDVDVDVDVDDPSERIAAASFDVVPDVAPYDASADPDLDTWPGARTPEPVVEPDPEPEPTFTFAPAAAAEPEPEVEPVSDAGSTPESADTPNTTTTPAPAAGAEGPTLEDLHLAVSSLTTWVARLADRGPALGAAGLDRVSLDEAVGDAVRIAMVRAQTSESTSARIELEMRILRDTIADLAARVDSGLGDLRRHVRLPDDVSTQLVEKVERLDAVARRSEAKLGEALDARTALDADITELLHRSSTGEANGELVAWTDVMLLAYELRSRVDDLEDQQRRFLQGLGQWRDGMAVEMGQLRDAVRLIARNLPAPPS